MSKEANLIKIESLGVLDVIHLHSSFYTSNKMAQSLKESLIKLFNLNRYRLIINMSQVQSIDSEGLGVLTNAYRQCTSCGGDFVLCEISTKDIFEVLEIVNIDKFIPIYKTQKEAIETLSA